MGTGAFTRERQAVADRRQRPESALAQHTTAAASSSRRLSSVSGVRLISADVEHSVQRTDPYHAGCQWDHSQQAEPAQWSAQSWNQAKQADSNEDTCDAIADPDVLHTACLLGQCANSRRAQHVRL